MDGFQVSQIDHVEFFVPDRDVAATSAVSCPFCRKTISATCLFCPHCEGALIQDQRNPTRKERFRAWMVAVGGGVLIWATLLSVGLALTCNPITLLGLLGLANGVWIAFVLFYRVVVGNKRIDKQILGRVFVLMLTWTGVVALTGFTLVVAGGLCAALVVVVVYRFLTGTF